MELLEPPDFDLDFRSRDLDDFRSRDLDFRSRDLDFLSRLDLRPPRDFDLDLDFDRVSDLERDRLKHKTHLAIIHKKNYNKNLRVCAENAVIIVKN